MRIFVYGSLMDPTVLSRRAGKPDLGARLAPAMLAGFRRVALRASRWPTLRREPWHVTEGAVVHINAEALRRLSAWEGPRYRLHYLIVGTPRGPVRAGVWIAPGATSQPWGQPWREP